MFGLGRVLSNLIGWRGGGGGEERGEENERENFNPCNFYYREL